MDLQHPPPPLLSTRCGLSDSRRPTSQTPRIRPSTCAPATCRHPAAARTSTCRCPLQRWPCGGAWLAPRPVGICRCLPRRRATFPPSFEFSPDPEPEPEPLLSEPHRIRSLPRCPRCGFSEREPPRAAKTAVVRLVCGFPSVITSSDASQCPKLAFSTRLSLPSSLASLPLTLFPVETQLEFACACGQWPEYTAEKWQCTLHPCAQKGNFGGGCREEVRKRYGPADRCDRKSCVESTVSPLSTAPRFFRHATTLHTTVFRRRCSQRSDLESRSSAKTGSEWRFLDATLHLGSQSHSASQSYRVERERHSRILSRARSHRARRQTPPAAVRSADTQCNARLESCP